MALEYSLLMVTSCLTDRLDYSIENTFFRNKTFQMSH